MSAGYDACTDAFEAGCTCDACLYQEAKETGWREGAAVAFGLMGMAEAIRTTERTYWRCVDCGRTCSQSDECCTACLPRLNVGDRCKVNADWSEFHGHHGTVTLTEPYAMVRVDGNNISIRFWQSEIELEVAK